MVTERTIPPWQAEADQIREVHGPYADYVAWEHWIDRRMEDQPCLGERAKVVHSPMGDCTCISCKDCPCAACETARWWDAVPLSVKASLWVAFNAAAPDERRE